MAEAQDFCTDIAIIDQGFSDAIKKQLEMEQDMEVL